MNVFMYHAARERMHCDPDWASQIEWSETVARPLSAEALARELIFVIANSGMKSPVARNIYRRVMGALEDKCDASTVFGHAGKVAAMTAIWNERDRLFQELATLKDSEITDWCGKQPYIGKITKWHASKNLGADVAKPDRWLERVAVLSNESVEALCSRLARESGDRVATVDLVIWWAMSHHVLLIKDGALIWA